MLEHQFRLVFYTLSPSAALYPSFPTCKLPSVSSCFLVCLSIWMMTIKSSLLLHNASKCFVTHFADANTMVTLDFCSFLFCLDTMLPFLVLDYWSNSLDFQSTTCITEQLFQYTSIHLTIRNKNQDIWKPFYYTECTLSRLYCISLQHARCTQYIYCKCSCWQKKKPLNCRNRP